MDAGGDADAITAYMKGIDTALAATRDRLQAEYDAL